MNSLVLNLSMIGEKNTGLGVYALNCRRELKRLFYCKEILSNLKLKNIDKNDLILSPSNIAIGSSHLASIRRLAYLTKIGRRKNLGFVYTPTQHGIIGYKNQVITIHDLICIHYPKQHKTQYWYFKYILPYIIKKCKAICTVSQTTKEEICKYYKVSKNFIYIIPNALNERNFVKSERDRSYLLAVGAGYEHKNIHELIKFADCWKRKYKLKIVSASGSYEKYLRRLMIENDLADRVEIKGFVSKEELERLYENCTALLYPSLWEGFGIPPLEAMRYGKPVIVSDIKVFKEIFGDAVIYVDIGNRMSWEKVFHLLNKNEVREKLEENAREVLHKFNWKKNRIYMKNMLLELEPRLKYVLK